MDQIQLGACAELITKGTTPTSIGKEFTENGVKFLRAQNVTNGKVSIDNDILFIDDATHNVNLKRSKIKKGDVLLTIAGSVGRTAIVDTEEELNCNQAVSIIRLNDLKLDGKYLSYFLSSHNAMSQFNKGKVTATISNLSLSQIRKLKIPIPPLPEQKRIAAILDAADALRQKDQQLIDHYNQLSQSLFLDMFGDPVTNDMEWPVKELGQIFDVRDGTHDSPIYQDDGYPLITSKNIKNGKLSFENVSYISKADFEKINLRSKVDTGDILMPMIGTIGNPVVIEDKTDFAIKNVALIKPLENSVVNPTIIYFLLKGHYLQWYSQYKNKGGTQKFLSLGDIRKMPVFIPSRDSQRKFISCINEIAGEEKMLNSNFNKANDLFNCLLQKAFTGELT